MDKDREVFHHRGRAKRVRQGDDVFRHRTRAKRVLPTASDERIKLLEREGCAATAAAKLEAEGAPTWAEVVRDIARKIRRRK